MNRYHATVSDEKTTEIIFQANVCAKTPGEARNKVKKYLKDNKPDIAALGLPIFTTRWMGIADIPCIE
jgi:hypothetical protein